MVIVSKPTVIYYYSRIIRPVCLFADRVVIKIVAVRYERKYDCDHEFVLDSLTFNLFFCLFWNGLSVLCNFDITTYTKDDFTFHHSGIVMVRYKSANRNK